jgi:hypothetical protein
MSERRERWRTWIDGPIRTNVLKMFLQRDAYMKVTGMLAANKSLPDSYWWEFMVDTYITTQAMAVRRQADEDRRVASLRRIMIELETRPQLLSREYWTGLWRDDPEDSEWTQREAERSWAKQYAGSTGDYIDPAIPAADMETLTSATSKVNRFVNRHIAHSQSTIHQPDPREPAHVDAASPDTTLSAKEVHEVVDVIGDLFKKYYNLFTASSYVFLVPVIQHDWLAAFRVPWMAAGYKGPDDLRPG